MILNFRVNGQRLRRLDDNYVVNLSKEYLQCNFSFTEDWTETTKYATFSVKGRHYRFEIHDDNVRVPNDVLKYKYFYLQLHGTDPNGEEVITTDELIIILKISGYTDTITQTCDSEVTDVYTVLKRKLDEKIDDVILDDRNLIFYSEGEIVKIIPLGFIDNYYDKEEINELLNETIIDVDTKDLATTGFLTFRRHNIT